MQGSGDDLIRRRVRDLWERTDFSATLFESLEGYAVVAADFDGTLLAYNRGARHLYGYAPDEAIGRLNVEALFPPEFVGAGYLQQAVDILLATGRFPFESEQVRKGGERFPAQVLFTLTRDRAGSVVGFVQIAQDLSERKRAEAGAARPPWDSGSRPGLRSAAPRGFPFAPRRASGACREATRREGRVDLAAKPCSSTLARPTRRCGGPDSTVSPRRRAWPGGCCAGSCSARCSRPVRSSAAAATRPGGRVRPRGTTTRRKGDGAPFPPRRGLLPRSDRRGTLDDTYAVLAVFNQGQANHAGSTLPVRIGLATAAGQDVSSSGAAVTALGIAATTDTKDAVGALDRSNVGTLTAVTAAGGSNPNNVFRLQGGTSPFYVYNLQIASGLAPTGCTSRSRATPWTTG